MQISKKILNTTPIKYRLRAALLLLVFCTTMLGNALHTFTSDCVHVHAMGFADIEKGDESTKATVDATADSDYSNPYCSWGDFTVTKAVLPIIGAYWIPSPHINSPATALLSQLLANPIHRGIALRGPPVLV